MTLIEQLWGSTNERLHTVGATALALSALTFVVVQPQQNRGLVVSTFLVLAVRSSAMPPQEMHGHDGEQARTP